MGLIHFNNIYKNKNILITGHTGFKGSWMALWLKKLGARVYGISHEKYNNNLKLDNEFKFEKKNELIISLSEKKNYPKIEKFLRKNKIQIVFFFSCTDHC